MPIARNTPLHALPGILPVAVAAYNMPGTRTAAYNVIYSEFVNERQQGIAAHGGLNGWVLHGGAAISIRALLAAFGMNAQGSMLVGLPVLAQTLRSLPPGSVQWIEGIALPLNQAPSRIMNPHTGQSLAAELGGLFTTLSAPGLVSSSGGFVAASKTLHCLFPNLAPMIDGRHSGISYFHILRATYTAPTGAVNWASWLGHPMVGVPNPSPRGAGRLNWDASRFMAALGINQHIYELWQGGNGHPGPRPFMALDPTRGTTGIPRIVDKLLW